MRVELPMVDRWPVSAVKSSLYLRGDGMSTGARACVNANGSTTWTKLAAGR
jgi:hypothetical protein